MFDKAQLQAIGRVRRDCKTAGSRKIFDQLIAHSPVFQEWAAEKIAGRNDALDLPYSARQLEHVIEEAVKVEFPELCFAVQADPLIQWDSTVKPGAKFFVWRQIEYAGDAEFFANMGADGLPSPSVMGAEQIQKVEGLGTQIKVSVQDLRAAAFAGEALEPALGEADRRGHSQLINDVAAWGRTDLGLPGFLNNPHVNRTPAAIGAAASPHWDQKTPVELIADVLGLANSIPEDTDELFSGNTMVMPKRYLRLLAQTRIGRDLDGSSDTVMEFLVKAFALAKMPMAWRTCEDLRASNSLGNLDNDAIMCFDRDPKRVVLVVPLFYLPQPTQQVGFDFLTPTESSVGGVLFRFPLSAAMLTDVGNS